MNDAERKDAAHHLGQYAAYVQYVRRENAEPLLAARDELLALRSRCSRYEEALDAARVLARICMDSDDYGRNRAFTAAADNLWASLPPQLPKRIS